MTNEAISPLFDRIFQERRGTSYYLDAYGWGDYRNHPGVCAWHKGTGQLIASRLGTTEAAVDCIIAFDEMITVGDTTKMNNELLNGLDQAQPGDLIRHNLMQSYTGLFIELVEWDRIIWVRFQDAYGIQTALPKFWDRVTYDQPQPRAKRTKTG